MSDPIRVFVNEQPLLVPAGSTVEEAIAAFDAALARALADGRAISTDGVGRPIPPTAGLAPGAIVRVVISARGAGPR